MLLTIRQFYINTCKKKSQIWNFRMWRSCIPKPSPDLGAATGMQTMVWDKQGHAPCKTSSSKNPCGSQLLYAPTRPKVGVGGTCLPCVGRYKPSSWSTQGWGGWHLPTMCGKVQALILEHTRLGWVAPAYHVWEGTSPHPGAHKVGVGGTCLPCVGRYKPSSWSTQGWGGWHLPTMCGKVQTLILEHTRLGWVTPAYHVWEGTSPHPGAHKVGVGGTCLPCVGRYKPSSWSTQA